MHPAAPPWSRYKRVPCRHMELLRCHGVHASCLLARVVSLTPRPSTSSSPSPYPLPSPISLHRIDPPSRRAFLPPNARLPSPSQCHHHHHHVLVGASAPAAAVAVAVDIASPDNGHDGNVHGDGDVHIAVRVTAHIAVASFPPTASAATTKPARPPPPDATSLPEPLPCRSCPPPP